MKDSIVNSSPDSGEIRRVLTESPLPAIRQMLTDQAILEACAACEHDYRDRRFGPVVTVLHYVAQPGQSAAATAMRTARLSKNRDVLIGHLLATILPQEGPGGRAPTFYEQGLMSIGIVRRSSGYELLAVQPYAACRWAPENGLVSPRGCSRGTGSRPHVCVS